MDPLAEMHSLFPLYHIAIGMLACAGIICFACRNNSKVIHLLVLLILAVMLWYTPYAMAGFSRLPDNAKNVGVSLYAPEILQGYLNEFSVYISNYPMSSIYSWGFMQITDMDAFRYMRFFPLACIGIFVLLGYTLVSKLFNSRTAFLALLMAFPGLHYITAHPSAHSMGVLILLTALILLFNKGLTFRIAVFFSIISINLFHPISPLLMAIFITALLISSFTGKLGKTHFILATMVLLCFAGWFLWPAVSLIRTDYQPVVQDDSTVINGNQDIITPIDTAPEKISIEEPDVIAPRAEQMYKYVQPEQFSTTKDYLVGTPFIYSTIHRLNVVMYLIYAIGTLIAITIVFYKTWKRSNNIKLWLLNIGGLSRRQLFIILSIVVLLVFTALLAEKGQALIERGLTFIILFCSILMSSVGLYLYERNILRYVLVPLFGILILFMTLTYSLVAYSIEAFTNYPSSESTGLEFIADEMLYEKKSFTTTSANQLILLSTDYTLARTWKSSVAKDADIVAFRMTGYHRHAMRYDLSFTDNRYTRYEYSVDNSYRYHNIYGNHSMHIYDKVR
jgi:hypothetical protein